MIDIIVDVGWR